MSITLKECVQLHHKVAIEPGTEHMNFKCVRRGTS